MKISTIYWGQSSRYCRYLEVFNGAPPAFLVVGNNDLPTSNLSPSLLNSWQWTPLWRSTWQLMHQYPLYRFAGAAITIAHWAAWTIEMYYLSAQEAGRWRPRSQQGCTSMEGTRKWPGWYNNLHMPPTYKKERWELLCQKKGADKK